MTVGLRRLLKSQAGNRQPLFFIAWSERRGKRA